MATIKSRQGFSSLSPINIITVCPSFPPTPPPRTVSDPDVTKTSCCSPRRFPARLVTIYTCLFELLGSANASMPLLRSCQNRPTLVCSIDCKQQYGRHTGRQTLTFISYTQKTCDPNRRRGLYHLLLEPQQPPPVQVHEAPSPHLHLSLQNQQHRGQKESRASALNVCTREKTTPVRTGSLNTKSSTKHALLGANKYRLSVQ